ncbi:high-potential iron-sulfur protein [Paucibacter sp. M5-1]|uniref:high-potential iron-sulfur protein n=1 Tax=Paucibacter sp. M5-1 TaxID=3015998 RepID=UPI003F812733
MSKTQSVPQQRRVFLIGLAGGGLMLGAGVHLQARAQAKLVDEKDAQAAALGYVADASKTDTKKYPKYAAGQNCANCALYQGKATDAAGGCPLFAGKQVAGKGWCSAWAKKG